jgi:two-component system, NtrC family, response regulator AtoC
VTSRDRPPAELETEAEQESGADDGNAAALRAYALVTEEAATRVVELAPDKDTSIGRALECEIVVESSRVSRRQAILRLTGGRVVLRDLGSRNGTRVNGAVVQSEERVLSGGDVVQVGPASIVVALTRGRARAGDVDDVPLDGVVVADPAMRKTFALAARLAKTSTTVLVLGETGVGKEVIAEQIHRQGSRSRGPFVRINCASLPDSIIERELFGHERGAFSGADRQKIGYLEAAHQGTLFLDEIGELPLATQVKLLRFLETRTLQRLGSTRDVTVDVRIVCATHRDLDAEVAAGRFREDLLFRINSFVIRVPPLRERPSEIALLAGVFARQLAEKMDVPASRFDPAALAALGRYGWPGNVRELRNAVEHCVVLADGAVIGVDHLPEKVLGRGGGATGSKAPPPPAAGSGPLRDHLDAIEKENIERALAAENGNQTRAAARLGISRRALIYKLEKYKIAR